MLYLDYLSYHNRFVHISILEKLAVGLGGLLLAVSSGTPVMNLAVFLFMSAVLWRAGMEFSYWLRLWGTLLPFLLTAVLTILFSFAWQPFEALWQTQLGPLHVGITAAGRREMESALLRSVAAASCLLMLAGTTPVSYLVAWASQVRVLRPVLEVALLAFRFIFVILHTGRSNLHGPTIAAGLFKLSRSRRSIGILAANLGASLYTARICSLACSRATIRCDCVSFPAAKVAPGSTDRDYCPGGLSVLDSH